MAGTSVTAVPSTSTTGTASTANTASTTSATAGAQTTGQATQTETIMPVTGSHNIWNELVFAFVGTAALAIIANMNEALGRVLLAVIVGFLFMWFMLHSGTIANWINQTVPQTQSPQATQTPATEYGPSAGSIVKAGLAAG